MCGYGMTLVLVVLAGLVALDVEGKVDTATIYDTFTQEDTNNDHRLTKQEMDLNWIWMPSSVIMTRAETENRACLNLQKRMDEVTQLKGR